MAAFLEVRVTFTVNSESDSEDPDSELDSTILLSFDLLSEFLELREA